MHKVGIDSTQNRARMQPRKEEFPPFMRFMNKEISESRITNPTPKKMNNIQSNNGKGITAQTAKFLKSGIDYSAYQTPVQKFAEKSAINSNISDSIDKDEEEWCDFVDFLAESAKLGIHQAASAAREQRAKAEREALAREIAKKIEQVDSRTSLIGR